LRTLAEFSSVLDRYQKAPLKKENTRDRQTLDPDPDLDLDLAISNPRDSPSSRIIQHLITASICPDP